MPDVKHFLQSKTIWFGIATTGISFLGWLSGQSFIQDNPQAVSAIGIVVGALTVYLRMVTNTGIVANTNGSKS